MATNVRVLQRRAWDCGLACVATVLGYAKLKRKMEGTTKGTTRVGMMTGATKATWVGRRLAGDESDVGWLATKGTWVG